MNWYGVPPMLVAMCILVYGILILRSNRRSPVILAFFMLAFEGCVWLFSVALSYVAPDESIALVWNRNVYIGLILIPSTLYHFTIEYLGLKEKRKTLFIPYTISGVYLCLSRGPNFITGVKKNLFGYSTQGGLLYYLFMAFFAVMTIVSISYLYRELKSAEPGSMRKTRIKYMFSSILVAALASVDFLPDFGVQIYPFGYLFIFAFIIINGYAIVKYRLLDMETFLYRSAGFLTVSFLAVALYAAAFTALYEYVGRSLNLPHALITGLLLIVLLWVFIPFKNWVWSLMDKVFYREKYLYRKTIADFMKRLNVLMDLDELIPMMVETISQTLKPDKVSIMILDEAEGEYAVKSQVGMSNPAVTLGRDDSFATWIFSQRKLVEKEGFSSDPWYSKMQEAGIEKFRELEAEICIPLIVRNQMIGIINLGRKSSGESYKKEDIELLSDLGVQSAIAVSNAMNYNLLKKRTDQLRLLSKLGQEMGQTLELGAMGKSIIDRIKELMRTQIVAILLKDEQTGELFVSQASGIDEAAVKETRIRPGEKISGWVAQLAQPVIVEDLETDSRFSKRIQERYYTKSLISAPLVVKGKVIGVINVNDSEKKKAFSSYDLEILTGICSETSALVENARLYASMKQAYLRTLQSLAEALDAKDQYTCGHCSRVRDYALKIAREMSLSQSVVDSIATAAVLHDIGKIGISESILSKPSKLTAKEYEEIKKHPEMSEKITRPIGLPESTLMIIKHHHEWFNGKGYPSGLEHENIPLGARILNIADAYDAMTSDRPYRSALTKDEAIEEMRRSAPDQFDPDIVDVFIKTLEHKSDK